jgi:hypothetical protein
MMVTVGRLGGGGGGMVHTFENGGLHIVISLNDMY